MINEQFKFFNETITPILTVLFNKILQGECFPQLWRETIIFPIFKGGSPHEPFNYCGISLLCSLKIFTKLINNRLVMWADKNNVRHEEHAGYRKNDSTVDQICNLQCLVECLVGRVMCINVVPLGRVHMGPGNYGFFPLHFLPIFYKGKMIFI